ncbi:MAG: metallophosphoesterase family protein [Pseudomonadota bacterium]
MAQSFFPRFWNTGRAAKQHALPEGLRVYAVGDVHGRFDCLERLEARIARHEANAGAADETLVIFLGDYIDRGPASREVVKHLSRGQFAGLSTRYLLGNHEDAMLGFLDDPASHVEWLNYGGMATLASYGVRAPGGMESANLAAMQQGLADAVPYAHLQFLRDLELWIELGDYLFVHAGIRPGLELKVQRRMDLLTIREPFLSTKAKLPWRVVHGHTVLPQAILGQYRISLDTGAYATGRLSCAVIQGDSAVLLD